MIRKTVGVISTISTGVEPSDLGTAAYKNTGTNSGDIPILDSNGKLNTSTIPAVAITDVFTANSQADMLALTAEKGDVCVRTDENKSYILSAEPASTLSNWIEISSSNYVTSVNTKTGAVTLDADDVGAVAKNVDITGNTKCKITYDSKGLVTAGADLQTSDIPDLSSSYVSTNNAITGNTKCKITYDSKGLVTAGADLQASDIPDISATYLTKNAAITSATKCKITYDTNGLVTAGADLQSADIPDISANYVATNSAITGATKCKITYDSKGLVTSGADLSSSDLPSHTHSATDITSGELSISNGGTGGATATAARTNLEVMKAFSIYSNTSGTQGTVTFNTGYTTAEFEYIKIIYKVESMYADVTLKAIGGNEANLITAHYSDSDQYMYINSRTMILSTNSLTLKSNTNAYMRYKQSGGNVVAGSDIIYITDVIGYKY